MGPPAPGKEPMGPPAPGKEPMGPPAPGKEPMGPPAPSKEFVGPPAPDKEKVFPEGGVDIASDFSFSATKYSTDQPTFTIGGLPVVLGNKTSEPNPDYGKSTGGETTSESSSEPTATDGGDDSNSEVDGSDPKQAGRRDWRDSFDRPERQRDKLGDSRAKQSSQNGDAGVGKTSSEDVKTQPGGSTSRVPFAYPTGSWDAFQTVAYNNTGSDVLNVAANTYLGLYNLSTIPANMIAGVFQAVGKIDEYLQAQLGVDYQALQAMPFMMPLEVASATAAIPGFMTRLGGLITNTINTHDERVASNGIRLAMERFGAISRGEIKPVSGIGDGLRQLQNRANPEHALFAGATNGTEALAVYNASGDVRLSVMVRTDATEANVVAEYVIGRVETAKTYPIQNYGDVMEQRVRELVERVTSMEFEPKRGWDKGADLVPRKQ
jgi:hypothetical protein